MSQQENGPSVQEKADKCEINVPVPFNFLRNAAVWCWNPDVKLELATREAVRKQSARKNFWAQPEDFKSR